MLKQSKSDQGPQFLHRNIVGISRFALDKINLLHSETHEKTAVSQSHQLWPEKLQQQQQRLSSPDQQTQAPSTQGAASQ